MYDRWYENYTHPDLGSFMKMLAVLTAVFQFTIPEMMVTNIWLKCSTRIMAKPTPALDDARSVVADLVDWIRYNNDIYIAIEKNEWGK